MAFRNWSTTASGNASPSGINWAEGQSPSTVNNSARETMAQIRQRYTPLQWCWIEHSATASVATQTTFKLAGDQTSFYSAGSRMRLSGGSTTVYGVVVSSSFTVETTITLTPDSGSLSASMTIAALSAATANTLPATYLTSASAAAQFITSNSVSVMIAGDFTYTGIKVFQGSVSFGETVAFTKDIIRPVVTTSATGSISVDLSTGSNFRVPLKNDMTMAAPKNAVEGQYGFLRFLQSTTASTSVNFNAAFKFGNSVKHRVDPSASKETIYQYVVRDVADVAIKPWWKEGRDTIGFWKEYDIGTLTSALGATTAQTHGLGRHPCLVTLILENTSTEAGYAVGERAWMPWGASGNNSTRGATLSTTTSVVNVTMATNMQLHSQSTFQSVDLTGSKWEVYIRVYE